MAEDWEEAGLKLTESVTVVEMCDKEVFEIFAAPRENEDEEVEVFVSQEDEAEEQEKEKGSFRRNVRCDKYLISKYVKLFKIQYNFKDGMKKV